ncbi:hypothetical protein Pelo_2897 [Pelomyxa schiedti]|nr:hypothetical protein Pelo_2897 [Pelomyxa schiedti]
MVTVYANGTGISGMVRGRGCHLMARVTSTTVRGSYIGEWKDNLFHGQGVRLWANSDRYDGQRVQGKEHGEGTKTWSRDGSSFTGLWVRGPLRGQGGGQMVTRLKARSHKMVLQHCHHHHQIVTERTNQQHTDQLNQVRRNLQQLQDKLQRKQQEEEATSAIMGKAHPELKEAFRLTTLFHSQLQKSSPEFVLLDQSLAKLKQTKATCVTRKFNNDVYFHKVHELTPLEPLPQLPECLCTLMQIPTLSLIVQRARLVGVLLDAKASLKAASQVHRGPCRTVALDQPESHHNVLLDAAAPQVTPPKGHRLMPVIRLHEELAGPGPVPCHSLASQEAHSSQPRVLPIRRGNRAEVQLHGAARVAVHPHAVLVAPPEPRHRVLAAQLRRLVPRGHCPVDVASSALRGEVVGTTDLPQSGAVVCSHAQSLGLVQVTGGAVHAVDVTPGELGHGICVTGLGGLFQKRHCFFGALVASAVQIHVLMCTLQQFVWCWCGCGGPHCSMKGQVTRALALRYPP